MLSSSHIITIVHPKRNEKVITSKESSKAEVTIPALHKTRSDRPTRLVDHPAEGYAERLIV